MNFRTIHVFLAQSYQPLKDLIAAQTELSKFDHLNLQKAQMGLNIWLVHASDRKQKQTLSKILKLCPLKFDSHVFEFYREPTPGMFIPIDFFFTFKQILIELKRTCVRTYICVFG